MSLVDYTRAYKLGKKDYQTSLMKGLRPTLPILDEILPAKESLSEIPLGLVQIPTDQIVGTKNDGRSNAFSSNFMPILRENTEFASKWARLSTSHVEEGIRDPIKAYEYMNKFYVEEGNKRVSVMKYFGVVSIPGMVTRILPKRTGEKENKIYYEFLDFYRLTEINYIWFSKLGSFARLLKVVGKGPEDYWNSDEKLEFSSVYSRFQAEYTEQGGEKLSITVGDAFLAFVSLFDYRQICETTTAEMKTLIEKTWQEFKLLEEDGPVELKMEPNKEKKPLLNLLLTPLANPKLKIAFIYEKTPASSAWTYSHELGRLSLEQQFPDEVSTISYDNGTIDNGEDLINDAIAKGCDIIFTTTPAFVQASVKAAIANPKVRILNCSLNTSHQYIRTYYARMHEAKFLMGAIAGAMAENDRISYVADYPIYGCIANINAFALGAKMINPRAEVFLEWSTMKDRDIMEDIRRTNVSCVSGKDMVIPEDASRLFGIYRLEKDQVRNLALPLWHWGKFYEKLIRTIMDGTWKYDESPTSAKAINYWWGMTSEVVDVICSQSLPIGTKRLVDLLKKTICSGEFNPFSGVLYSQTGMVQGDPNQVLSPEQIATMDWLAENVIGEIPRVEQLQDQAKPVISQQGLQKEQVTL